MNDELKPRTRKEQYYEYIITGENAAELKPRSREEQWFEKIAEAGGSGGTDVAAITVTESDNQLVIALQDSEGQTIVESSPVGVQGAITDGSATVASIDSSDIITLKAGVVQTNGAIANSSDSDITLAKVAKTGDYDDLNNTPNLAAVALSGSYSDLVGAPTDVSSFNNDAGYINSLPSGSAVIASESNSIITLKAGLIETDGVVANSSDNDITLAKVAKTGNYDDLSNIPIINQTASENIIAFVALSTIVDSNTVIYFDTSVTGETTLQTVLRNATVGRGQQVQNLVKTDYWNTFGLRVYTDDYNSGTKFGLAMLVNGTIYPVYSTESWSYGSTVTFAGGWETINPLTGKYSLSNISNSVRVDAVLDIDDWNGSIIGMLEEIRIPEGINGNFYRWKNNLYKFDSNEYKKVLIEGDISLATVATTGDYNDLSNKPTIPSPYEPTNTSNYVDTAELVDDQSNIGTSQCVLRFDRTDNTVHLTGRFTSAGMTSGTTYHIQYYYSSMTNDNPAHDSSTAIDVLAYWNGSQISGTDYKCIAYNYTTNDPVGHIFYDGAWWYFLPTTSITSGSLIYFSTSYLRKYN